MSVAVGAFVFALCAGQSLQAIKMCFQYLPRAYKHGAKGT
jgi:alcohol dehydrogenase class IV